MERERWLKVERLYHAAREREVNHARYYWLLLAENRLTRRLFGAMLRRIELLPLPSG